MFIRKSILILVFALIAGFSIFYVFKNKSTSAIEESSALIQQQIKNVGKLVVSEAYFAEILTFKDQQSYLGGLVSFNKKAIFVVNAKVTVAFNLHQMEYKVNNDSKTIEIIKIPTEEISIANDIKFYDVEQSKFNPFSGQDYNKINQFAKQKITEKINKSSLKSNSKNRLISEISTLLLSLQQNGWKIKHNENKLNNLKL